MRVFVAGGTGVVGRRLVPQLVARGHQVTATTTSPAKLGLLEQLGADAVVMDGLDAVSVGEAVAAARPDAIVNQMTALSVAHAGKPNLAGLVVVAVTWWPRATSCGTSRRPTTPVPPATNTRTTNHLPDFRVCL